MEIDEINATKEWLASWRSPTEVRENMWGLMCKLGKEDIFRQAGTNFVYEVFTAAQFAEMRGAVSVRKVPDLRPDAELRFEDGVVEKVEIVEADKFGRRRGDEYRNISWGVVQDFPIEELPTVDDAFAALQKAALLKAGKAQRLNETGTPYPSNTDLLIYLNIHDFDEYQAEIEAIFADAVFPAKEWFSSIWILWKARIYKIFLSEAVSQQDLQLS